MVHNSDNDGYTDVQRRKIRENGIVPKLTELQGYLSNQGYAVSDPDLSFPQDPTIWITELPTHVRVQLKMQLTGEKVVLNFRPECPNPHSPGAADKERLRQIIRGKGFQCRNNGAYAPLADFKTKEGFPGGIPRQDMATILELLSASVTKLQG